MGIKVELDLQAILTALRQLPEEERQYVAQQLLHQHETSVGVSGEPALSPRERLEGAIAQQRAQGKTGRISQAALDAIEPMSDEEYADYLEFRKASERPRYTF